MICKTQNSGEVKNSNPTTLELDDYNNLIVGDMVCTELHLDEAGNVYAPTDDGYVQVFVTIYQC